MAQPGEWVPAWKRLGLKLKNSDQSTRQGDNHQHGEPSDQQGGTLDANEQATPPKGQKSKLGKRKHQSEPAEADGLSQKKTKVRQEHHHDHGHAGPEESSVPDAENATLESAADATTSTVKVHPKGDPNYRKKKGRKSNDYQLGASHSAPAQGHDQVQSARLKVSDQITRTPSLSPGEGDAAHHGSTLLASTEADLPAFATPTISKTTQKSEVRSSLSASPSKFDRRKSVTFTPDTKTADGTSAHDLFKKWAAEQKGQSEQFTPAEVTQFAAPPKVHPGNDKPPTTVTQTNKGPAPTGGSSKGKKDPSRYLNYLAQYHNNRSNWKFNKAIQNDVLENALNVFRIPEEHSEALIEYVKGLQGAGAIERLRASCMKTLEEVEEPGDMGDAEARAAAKESALQERLSKERKRRRSDRDLENFHDHPHKEGYLRRLKRRRAEALLTALGIPAPDSLRSNIDAAAKPKPYEAAGSGQNDPRKRKSRTDVSSDETSDSSSSEESDSSSSESESDDGSSTGSGPASDDGGGSDLDSDEDSEGSSNVSSSEDGSSGDSDSDDSD